jgi:hypothetical protein
MPVIRAVIATLMAALTLATPALARGGQVAFVGGTSDEQQTVLKALAASTFDFNQIPQVTVKIVPDLPANEQGEAIPGEVTLPASGLESGQFFWGTVQHEFFHELDYLLLTDAQRAQAMQVLGATAWYDGTLSHADQGRERFASTLAFQFWQAVVNNQSPRYKGTEIHNPLGLHKLMVEWGYAAPICRMVKVKRGFYDKHHHWHKPVFAKSCG